MSHYELSLDEFRRLAADNQAPRVPVYRTLLGDCLTPVAAYAGLAGDGCGFLLESVEQGERVGRYSFLGADPFLIFRAGRDWCEVQRRGETAERRACRKPLTELNSLLAANRSVKVPGLPRFSGGAVGYAAYDAVRMVEHLPNEPPDDRELPDLYFAFYETMVIFDHVRKVIQVVAHADVANTATDAAYTEACARIDALVERLTRSTASDVPPAPTLYSLDGPVTDFVGNFKQGDYEAAVEKAKEYIAAGDIFQVVLSQRLHARTTARPFEIYRVLRVINPSPYMFLINFADEKQLSLIGSSPEVMVRLEEDEITLRPIAGTRPRGKDRAEDAALAKDLLADPKEIAEHTMLLDLGRNDVGRVATYGSVRLTEQMVVEYYSHVMHIVSNVTGKLRSGLGALDTLTSCHPAGTVSGAPKIRAMEIIDELEPVKRGPYAGAVGYFDLHGNMDTCIALRTIVMLGQDVYVQAGAGIVADSVPANEWQECLNKAQALLAAIRCAERSFA